MLCKISHDKWDFLHYTNVMTMIEAPYLRLDTQAEGTVQLLKVIANVHRLVILHHLMSGETTVTKLEQSLSISQPALSQHLARMRQEGILQGRRHGQNIFYSICDNRVKKLLPLLEELAAHSSAFQAA